MPCGNRFMVIAILAITIATGFGFLGGSAAMSGNLPLPGALKERPIAVSLTGGVAVFAVVLILGWSMYVRDCTTAPAKPLITSVEVDSDGDNGLKIKIEFRVQDVRADETVLIKVGPDEKLSPSQLSLPPQPLDDWRKTTAVIGIRNYSSDHGWIQIVVVDSQGNLISTSDPYRFQVSRS